MYIVWVSRIMYTVHIILMSSGMEVVGISVVDMKVNFIIKGIVQLIKV